MSAPANLLWAQAVSENWSMCEINMLKRDSLLTINTVWMTTNTFYRMWPYCKRREMNNILTLGPSQSKWGTNVCREWDERMKTETYILYTAYLWPVYTALLFLRSLIPDPVWWPPFYSPPPRKRLHSNRCTSSSSMDPYLALCDMIIVNA